MKTQPQLKQSGFTLVEVIVATTIFVIVVAAMLGLFDYTLKVNRRVQAMREVAQGTRTFAETLTREIRNGRIDYEANTWATECDAANYADTENPNKSLGVVSRNGDKLCFYFDPAENNAFKLKKLTAQGEIIATVFSSSRFRVIPETFRFIVGPTTDPTQQTAGLYPGIQPHVTIVAQFEINTFEPTGPIRIDYQTTISTDVYDIPHR